MFMEDYIMTINDFSKLKSGETIPLFNENSAIEYDVKRDEFIAYNVNDAGDYEVLSRQKHLEKAIEDIVNWFNE